MSSDEAKAHTRAMYEIEICVLQKIADSKNVELKHTQDLAKHFGWFGRTTMNVFLKIEQQQAELSQTEADNVKAELQKAIDEGRA